MRRVFCAFFLVSILGFSVFLLPYHTKADSSCDVNNIPTCNDPNGPCFNQLQQCAAQLQQALAMSENATRPLESELERLQTQLDGIKNRVATIETDVTTKKQIINKGYKDITTKTIVLNEKVRDYYIKSTYNSPLFLFLSSNSASDLTQALAYQKAITDQDKLVITNIALSIIDLEQKKKNLEEEETRLVSLKGTLDDQSTKLDKIVMGAKAYQANLNNQIGELSVRQQQLLAQKYASLGISLSAYNMQGGCKSDLVTGADPGFSPKIGFFTYGVPNRVGLNQFGALGRSQSGQNYQTILTAYYNNIRFECKNMSTIAVNGYGQISFSDYLKGLGEMPDNWGDMGGFEAFKAQVVAAASYAYAYTNGGNNSICTTDQCQVYIGHNKGGKWEQAVNDIANACGNNTMQVMVSNDTNQVIKAWFSSTHGGYELTSADIGWSTTSYTKRMQDASGSITNFADLQSKAYDRNSPWFYCDWGSRSSANGTAWLKPEETADIVNAIALAQADSSVKEHLYQLDKPNPAGTDTWDTSRVKQELQNRGQTAYNTVSSISVNADFGVGKVNSVTVTGDSGIKTFPGDFFKTYFNIRAPGNVQIVGPLYNIEIR
jgi:SpoIID/LytB domain protein